VISLRNIRAALPQKRITSIDPDGSSGRRLGISIALSEPSPKDVFTGLNRIGRPQFFLDKDITILAGMRREAALYAMDSLRRRRHSLFRAVML